MRNLKKFSSIALAALLTTSFVACGKKSAENDPDTIVITAVEQGYGLEWLSKLAKEYEKQSENSVKIIKKIGNTGESAIDTEISSLAVGTDIFVQQHAEFFKNIYSGSVVAGDGKRYDTMFEPLNDIYETQLPGDAEGSSIKTKMYEQYLAYYNVDNNYYALPWQNGFMGIVLNCDVWNMLGYTDADIPRTTEEMFKISENIKQKASSKTEWNSIAPFIYSAESEYYSSFIHIWMAQYEGNEVWQYYLDGKDPDGNVSEWVYTFKGQRKTLEVLDRLVDKDNQYQHKNSNELSFTDMQGYFLNDQAVFCVNGAWLDIEMANYAEKNIKFIRTPVISSVVERCSFHSNNVAEDDAKLCELIDFVDVHTQKGDNAGAPSYATPEDVEIIREARQMAYKRGNGQHVMIPSYSTKIDKAKDFLRFMYSDTGLKIYYEATQGGSLPLNLSTGEYPEMEMSMFRRNIKEVLDEGHLIEMSVITKARIYALGGVLQHFNNGGLGLATYNLRENIRTIDQILDKNQTYVSQNWANIQKIL